MEYYVRCHEMANNIVAVTEHIEVFQTRTCIYNFTNSYQGQL